MKKHTWFWIGGICILAGALILLSHLLVTRQGAGAGSLESVRATPAPWPVDNDGLRARLAALGLPALNEEGQALHIHQHLDIFVHGQAVAVPADIGINEAAGFISPIHVHDTSSIVHVESPTVQDFTLGQFFAIWGVRLSSDCLGSYCSDADDQLQVYVNGARYTGDPTALVLASHQEIAIIYGTAAEIPTSIPASYTFPAGY